MKEIIHVLVIHLSKWEKILLMPQNSQYDIVTRYYADNDYQEIMHKFNLVVVVGKSTNDADLTIISDLACKLGIKVFLPKDYDSCLHKLDEMLLGFVENKEHIKTKREFFENKKTVLLGTELYNNKYAKQEFLQKMASVVLWEYLLDKKDDIPKKDNVFIIINSAKMLHENIKERLKKMGFAENIDFITLEDYCYATDRANEAFKEWISSEQDGSKILHKHYKDRTEIMSQWILPEINSIAEFGCGECHLKNMLRSGVKYIGIDYKKRNEETIVCDVNNDTLPELNVDAVFLAGFFMYVKEPENFLEYIASLNLKQLILSYVPLEVNLSHNSRYGNRSFENYFSSGELIAMIQKKTGLVLEQAKLDLVGYGRQSF
jgi:hypothetical protein